jgi:hypothetical protein
VNLADFLNGASYVIKPPPDALQEFSVRTSNYSAELGHAAGGVLNACIKSGTNVIHGSLWEFFRNDHLNAIDWFSAGKPEYRENQFSDRLALFCSVVQNSSCIESFTKGKKGLRLCRHPKKPQRKPQVITTISIARQTICVALMNIWAGWKFSRSP